MALVQLPLIPGTLSAGICFTGPTAEQQRLNAYMAVSYAQLNGMAFYNYGSDTPGVEVQSYPWLNTNDGRWYFYQGGQWRSPRPLIEQDSNYRILWIGLEADVPTISGGTAGVATQTSGPFWEIDTDFAGRIPMAPGAIPSSDPAKTLTVAEDYGVGTITAPLPEHSHGYRAQIGDESEGDPYPTVPNSNNAPNFTFNTEPAGVADAKIQMTPPVRGIWVLKPTIRIWSTI